MFGSFERVMLQERFKLQQSRESIDCLISVVRVSNIGSRSAHMLLFVCQRLDMVYVCMHGCVCSGM